MHVYSPQFLAKPSCTQTPQTGSWNHWVGWFQCDTVLETARHWSWWCQESCSEMLWESLAVCFFGTAFVLEYVAAIYTPVLPLALWWSAPAGRLRCSCYCNCLHHLTSAWWNYETIQPAKYLTLLNGLFFEPVVVHFFHAAGDKPGTQLRP